MPKLIFPENDVRSNGKSFNEKRPWLFQGANCVVDYFQKGWYTLKVQFTKAPKGNYDLVSPEFLKEEKIITK